MALNMLEGFPLAKLPAALPRAPAPAAGDHQACLRRPRSLDRRSGPGARAGRGDARQGLRRRATQALRSQKAGALHGRRPRRRHHRLRRRRRAGQHRQRDPEPVQRVRLRAWSRRAPGSACRTAAATSRWTRRIRASLAPGKRPFHTLMASITHARRPAADGLRHHGWQRTGDVPRPGAHQRLRLRARHPGGDRAATLPHRRLPARRAGRPDPSGEPGAGARVHRAQATGPRNHAGAGAVLPGRSRPRRDREHRRHLRRRRRSREATAWRWASDATPAGRDSSPS